MNELLNIKTENDQITVLARDLHKFLEATERFSSWFERMTQYGLEEGVDYLGCKVFNALARQELQDYQLTIDAAKQISMLQRNDKGLQARKYFIEVEKAWNTPEKIMARALEFAKKEITNLHVEIGEMKPKAEFFDQVASSKSAIEIGQAAKVLNIPGIGRNKLFEILRRLDILMNDNIPYQTYVDRGYFRVIEQKYNVHGEVRINFKTLVYQRGLDYIRNKVMKYKEK